MKLIPAIDILDGKVVRLAQGNYHSAKEYSQDPLSIAIQLKNLGYDYLHIIDLSGAKSGCSQIQLIVKQITDLGLQVQVGGGIRTEDCVESYLNNNVNRVILGTRAVQEPDFWNHCTNRFGKDKFVLSLDVKDGIVMTHGWAQSNNATISHVLDALGHDSVSHLIVTDIRKDGMMEGINVALYNQLREQLPGMNVIPAGGFSSLDDFNALNQMGYKEVIVGKAIYDKPQLFQQIQKERSKIRLVESVNWAKLNGLIPVIIQSSVNCRVLMLGYMNKEAMKLTLDQGRVIFYSRTREKLWIKGETSGNYLKVKSMSLDCDQDALLIQVEHVESICHNGTQSCFDHIIEVD